jgi:hypothetical protein
MSRRRFFKDKEKRRRAVHIISGVTILVHAFEKYDTGHGPWIFFGVAGLIFLSIAVLHPLIEKKAPWIDGVFFVIEAALSVVIAIDFIHMRKKGLPVCYFVLAAFQLFMAFRMSRKGIRHHRSHQQLSPQDIQVEGSLPPQ